MEPDISGAMEAVRELGAYVLAKPVGADATRRAKGAFDCMQSALRCSCHVSAGSIPKLGDSA